MAMRVRHHFLTTVGVRAFVATALLLGLSVVSATGGRAAVSTAVPSPVLLAAADVAPAAADVAPAATEGMGATAPAGHDGHGGAAMPQVPVGQEANTAHVGHAPADAAPAQDSHVGHGTADTAQPPAEHVHPVPPPTTGKLGQPGQPGQSGQFGQPGQGASGDPSAQTPLAGVDEHLGDIIPEGILLRDESGQPIDPRSLMDVPVIIAPIYYSCPTVCNMLQSSLARVLPQVSLQPGKDYRVLSVSFDETDTPQLAARKKQNYFAAMNFAYPEDGWRFLSGDLASINRFMDAIGFRFTRQGRDFIHPVVLVVTAPGGKVVRYLYGQNFMPFDLTMAVTEASHGTIGLSVKRVLSYCFTYDPEGRRYVFDFMRIAGLIILFGAAVLLFVLVRGGPRGKERKGTDAAPPAGSSPSGPPPSGPPTAGTPPD
jgi:protein SCO1/2